jgi:drug/metabolite transporter (DMT)-like permease
MSQETETALRKSLEAIDSFRRRITAIGWLTAALTFGAYFWLAYVARTSNDLKRLIMTAVFGLTCVIAWCTYALAVFHIRMTKRILRAIELASRESKGSV